MGEDVQRRQDDLKQARQEAERATYDALLRMATKLREIVGGRLHDVPNLGTGSKPYRAARLRGNYIDTKLPVPEEGEEWGRYVIVLDEWCRLVKARRNALGEHDVADIGPEDIVAQDGPRMMTTVQQVVEDHLRKVEKQTKRYRELQDFAHRISEVMSR